jgi:hypothetical protein
MFSHYAFHGYQKSQNLMNISKIKTSNRNKMHLLKSFKIILRICTYNPLPAGKFFLNFLMKIGGMVHLGGKPIRLKYV